MTSPELLRVEDSGVFIEKAHIGDTQLVAALCEHVPENMPAVAKELQDCSVIAVEFVGLENEEVRNQKSDMYTRILDSQIEDQAGLKDKMAPHRTDAIGALVYEFIGSGKQLVFIDINKDHSEFPAVQESTRKRQAHTDAIFDVAPVRTAYETLLDAAQAAGVSYDIRDGILANDIKELSQRFAGRKIGLMMGASHAGAIDAVAEHDSPEATKKNRQNIMQGQNTFGKIVQKFRDGQEVDEALVNKGLMESYFMAAQVPKEERYDAVDKMDDDMISRVLKSINETATRDIPTAQKRQIVFDHVRAVAEIAGDL